MALRHRIVVLAVSLVSLAAALTVVPRAAQDRPVEPGVIFGDDVGFRPDAVQRFRGRITGTLVVRVNGEWMEAHFSPKVVPTAP